MDIERLKADPAYWDEVAPEGATHCLPLFSPVTWYRRTSKGWQFWTCFSELWMHTDILVHLLEGLILRPSQTQWRGPEDGLPPVGTVCEAKYAEDWHRCTVVAHLKDHRGMTDAVFQAEDDWYFHQRPEMFRPLKSDKERAVDAAMRASGHEKVGGFWTGSLDVYHAFGKAYDAGLLRLPEEQ